MNLGGFLIRRMGIGNLIARRGWLQGYRPPLFTVKKLEVD